MACFKPIKAWKVPDPGSKSGFRPVFDLKRGDFGIPVDLPCRQCIGCRQEHARQWATRLMFEAQFHQHKYFLTQTYDDAHLPRDGSLVKRHIQNFNRALRKHYPRGTIRSFQVGEYGDQTQRPHFHQLLFGAAIPDLRRHSKAASGEQLYTSDFLSHIWGKGFVIVGSVTQASCEYVARYSMKKITGQKAAMHYERFDPETGERYWLEPEFATMSRRGGIGRRFYDEFSTDLYPSDFAVSKGKKLAVPRFFDKLLEADDPELYGSIKARRRAKARSHGADNTPERRKVREDVLKARIGLRKRSI